MPRTSRHLPNDVLRELHGFIHMFEDTPEFVARDWMKPEIVYFPARDGLDVAGPAASRSGVSASNQYRSRSKG